MISLECLLNIIASEAVGGPDIPEDHPDPDNFFYNNRPERDMQSKIKLPPIRYNLELVKNPCGSYEWVE